ncbi:uncharacterized protein [Nicotiana sylvestris]|uniref:Molybdenum cofactor sulfurase-like n=1 Tax=Nicotiana sylvestris TaxID=4096 RepID=A0A1U7WZK9_NICSY|nr:PREDICTED: molybdenum cofactor sulfurase-like [Nicotiana sylvestris]
MSSSYMKEAEKISGQQGCCPNPLLILLESQNQQPLPKIKSTTAACRHSFAATTTSSFFPNTHFTNHESLPSYQESFAQFIKTYPKYSETRQIDKIRSQEYYHLSISNHVCLDYIGIGLFSYSQVQSQLSALVPMTSSSSPSSSNECCDYPFFDISCKSVNLKSELLHGGHGSELESSIKKKIMNFLNMSQNEYSMVFTANRSSAFKLIAESYPFQTSRKLLTVYDHESEALETMVNTSEKRGASILSAEFKWPRLRIHSEKLRKLIIRKKKKKKSKGLFVFPLQSRVTGASYSYQWMSLAQENGWHVLLDACALGPKDMDSFGLSLFHPDFLICSFYKIFGENPTGFGCLLVKKSLVSMLEASVSAGIVSLVPPTQLLNSLDSSGSGTELEQKSNFYTKLDELHISGSRSAHVPANSEKEEREVAQKEKSKEEPDQSIVSLGNNTKVEEKESLEIHCRCLDHVDSLGLMQIGNRRRYLVNWLISALLKLQHPNRLDHFPLVRIYGPKIKFDRGTALAFNLFDWKGERVEPILIQKLADRNNISLSHGLLSRLWFLDKYEEEKQRNTERNKGEEKDAESKKSKRTDFGISVVTIALSFLANFEDVYRLWTFIAQFLDADFVEKERWRYISLYQKTIEV